MKHEHEHTKTWPLFKLAIVGVGKISQGSHIPAALSSPLVEIGALVDPALDRARKIANDFGLDVEIQSSIGDVESDIDGVLIATPNHLHAPLAIECLKNGIHVLIEKPLASSVKEGLDIIEAEKVSCKIAAVGYCTRFYPNFQLLKKLLDKQYFGKVTKFAYQFGTPGGWATFSNYIMSRETIGGGVLVVTGTHFIDRMLFLFGYPDEIKLEDDSLGGPEANARLFIKFKKSGQLIEGYVHFSKTTALTSGLVLETEKGDVVLSDNDKDLVLYPNNEPNLALNIVNIDHTNSHSSQFQQQIDDFADCCQMNHKPMVSAQEALLSLKLIDEAYKNRSGFPDKWHE